MKKAQVTVIMTHPPEGAHPGEMGVMVVNGVLSDDEAKALFIRITNEELARENLRYEPSAQEPLLTHHDVTVSDRKTDDEARYTITVVRDELINVKPLTMAEAIKRCKAVGFIISRTGHGDELRVREKGAPRDAGYFTNDLLDAVQTAEHWRAEKIRQAKDLEENDAEMDRILARQEEPPKGYDPDDDPFGLNDPDEEDRLNRDQP